MVITIARNVRFELRRGAGSSLEVLYGKVSLTPTLNHNVSNSVVLPYPTTFDLIKGIAIATNVAPTPAPVDGQIEWAYLVKVVDNHGKKFEFLVGVPDGTTEINFNVLPRYYETKPPLFGEGPQGPAGTAVSIAIGTVASGTTPAVTNSGTATDAILNFTLAKGDKGDTGATVATIPAKLPTEPPSSYTAGTQEVFQTSNADWPSGSTSGGVSVETVILSPGGRGYQIARAANSGRMWLRTPLVGGVNGWSPFREMASTEIATPLLNGLMPALDKAKLDGMTPAANSKTFAALASTYPAGFSTLQVRAADGWPITTNAQVVTNKTNAGNNGVVQWIYPVEGGMPLYRTSDAAGFWLAYQSLGSSDLLAQRVPSISVSEFGAVGDGATNDTIAIQAALDYAGSLPQKTEVTLPPKIFNVGELFVPSGVTFSGVGQATLNRVVGNNVVNLLGSVGPEVEISAAIADGSKTISTKTPHGLSVGDTVYLKSQRDSLSVDAHVDWRLGYATPASGACYYAEFLMVATVPSSTQITVTTAPVFPSYRPDKTQDSSTTARASASIQKVTANKGVTVKNITFTGAPAQCVKTEWATGFTLDNLTFESQSDRPGFSMFKSFSGSVRNCKVYYPVAQSSLIYLRNAFKVISSVGIDIDNCYVENGSQCFDFTYTADFGPSMNCTLRNSRTLWAQTNGATTHGGSYAITLESNNFDQCQGSGVSIRSRETRFTGNSVTHAYDSATTYGVRLYEGWAVDCIISNNTVNGFGFGFDVMDAGDQGEKFGRIGANVTDNNFVNCMVAIACLRSSGNPYRGESGLTIKDNNVSKVRVGGLGINLGSHVYGASIVGNTLDGNGAGATAVKLDLNCNVTRVDQNDIMGWTSRGIDHRGYDSSDLTGSSVYVWGNLFRASQPSVANRYVATGGGVWRGYAFHGDPAYFTILQSISGSRGGNTALAALLTRLNNMGILTDNTTA